MPVSPSDILFFQSELEGSSGGAMSALVIPKDAPSRVFQDVTQQQMSDGAVDYRKIFVVNSSAADTLSASLVWLLMQPVAGGAVAIGLGGPTDTDGSAIAYSSPMSRGAALATGDIPPGGSVAVWIRRVVDAGAKDFDVAFFQAVVEGSSVPAGPVDVSTLASFAWGLVPPAEEDTMASTLSYELTLQATDPDNLIKTQADISDSIPLNTDVLSDDSYSIPGNAIDFPLHVIDAGVDVLLLVAKNGPLTAKINSLTGTPVNFKKLFVDGDAIASVFISNPGGQAVSLRAVMASRD